MGTMSQVHIDRECIDTFHWGTEDDLGNAILIGFCEDPRVQLDFYGQPKKYRGYLQVEVTLESFYFLFPYSDHEDDAGTAENWVANFPSFCHVTKYGEPVELESKMQQEETKMPETTVPASLNENVHAHYELPTTHQGLNVYTTIHRGPKPKAERQWVAIKPTADTLKNGRIAYLVTAVSTPGQDLWEFKYTLKGYESIVSLAVAKRSYKRAWKNWEAKQARNAAFDAREEAVAYAQAKEVLVLPVKQEIAFEHGICHNRYCIYAATQEMGGHWFCDMHAQVYRHAQRES